MKINSTRLLKILIIVFCIALLFIMAINEIVASDILHISSCNIQNCEKCLMIYNSINFIKNINYIIVYVTILNAMIPLICIIVTKLKLNKKDTLISLNVVLIE